MKTPLLVLLVALVITPSYASTLDCRGILDYAGDALKGSFRCTFRHNQLRRVGATCHDGDPGCDTGDACDGRCRFAVCIDPSCAETVGVTVPLRHGGTRKGKAVFRTGTTRAVFRCLPPRRGACVPGVSTTTTTTTTSTTLPGRPCTATLSGAVDATVGCTTAFGISRIGLSALIVRLTGAEVQGATTALLVGDQPGTYRLGHGIVLLITGFDHPASLAFHAADPSQTQATLTLDSVTRSASDGTFEVHGTLDTTLQRDDNGDTLRVQAGF